MARAKETTRLHLYCVSRLLFAPQASRRPKAGEKSAPSPSIANVIGVRDEEATMANKDGGWSPVGTFPPLAVLLLAACTAPDTEGAADAASADIPEVAPMGGEAAGNQQRLGGANSSFSERGPRYSASANAVRTTIATEAVRHRSVPPALALAVAKVGSNMASNALGAAGAVGTMQIPPALADEFDLNVDDLHEAGANIRAGIACLAALEERYAGDWQLALSHYRGGPLKKADGMPVPHAFTRRYVRDVLRWWRLYRHDPLTGAWLRKAQGLPRFVSTSGRGHAPIAVAARPTSERANVGGNWRAVPDGRRFR